MIQLDHPLGDIEGVVIGQGHNPGPEANTVRALSRRRQEHLRRGNHFPAGGMVLAAPELVIAQLVQMGGELEVIAKLQCRVLANRMVRSKEGTELETRHGRTPGQNLKRG